MTHPFIDRLRSERQVLNMVNKAIPEHVRPLKGLAPSEVRRWLTSLDGQRAGRLQVEEQLVHLGKRIRAQSTASHRGVIWEPNPANDQFNRELQWLEETLKELMSGRRTNTGATGANVLASGDQLS